MNSDYINLETQNSNFNSDAINSCNINNNLQKRLFTNDFIIEKPKKTPDFKIHSNKLNNDQLEIKVNKLSSNDMIANNYKYNSPNIPKSDTKKIKRNLIDPLNINENNSMSKDEMINNYMSLKNIYDPNKGGNKIIFKKICSALILLREKIV